MSLVVVGSVAIDNITSPEGSADNVMGGSASYFSCAASNFTKVRMVGVVGEDYPQEFLNLLQSKDIDTSGIVQSDGKSFCWTGKYSDDFSEAQTLDIQLGVFESFQPQLSEDYRKSDFLFLANIDPDLQMNVTEQMDGAKFVVMDTMNHWIDGKNEQLKNALQKVDMIILNDAEAKMLSGQSSLITAAKTILQMGPEYVIVKKGEHGAFLMDKQGRHFTTPGFPIERVVDTTGAGDSFAGGFMGYVANLGEVSFEAFCPALIYGACTSSFTVEDFSLNKLSSVSREHIDQRFEQIIQMTSLEQNTVR